MNEEKENIGARRLHTILEHLLEDISFDLPNPEVKEIILTKEDVIQKFSEEIKQTDVDKYIL